MEEISLNILDIARNSIKANATEVIIKENSDDKKLEVEISDNGTGMDEETLQKVTDPFFSSRKTRKIGLGVPFFKMVALMSGGEFEIKSKLGVGTKVTATFYKDNIDMMPLGNIVDTIITLMTNESNTDIIFTHALQDKTISFDTKVIREIFAGFDLSNPKVIVACKNHLENEYNKK